MPQWRHLPKKEGEIGEFFLWNAETSLGMFVCGPINIKQELVWIKLLQDCEVVRHGGKQTN